MHGGPPDKFREAVNVSELTGSQQLDLVNQKVDEHGYNTFLSTKATDGNFILFGYYSNQQ